MSSGLVLGAGLAYLGLLFAVAYHVEHRPGGGLRRINSSLVYTLSLAVYCTSWTFQGSVGRASQAGIAFLPIYLGPTLTFCLGWLILRKILRVSKANRITSIADFIASRFGKSRGLAGLVTVIALIGTIPYVALQLKAVSTSFTILVSGQSTLDPAAAPSLLSDTGLWAAVLLTLFAMLFGSRSIHPGEHHHGMVAAVALESIVKLLALTAVGLFVGFGLFHGFGDLFQRAAAAPQLHALFDFGGARQSIDWIAMMVLSMAAVVCLPRQFQVMVVENVDERHLDRALWAFPLYLLAINLFILPIALAGLLTLPPGADPDAIVLTVPMQAGHQWLALVAFLGGLSASAGMVVVCAAALSSMVCNDLVMPALLRWKRLGLAAQSDLTQLLLWIRRAAMAVLMLLGYLFVHGVAETEALVSIGLMSFAAVAQFAPAILAGLFWRRATKAGAIAGISAGFVVWLYTLLLPTFSRSGVLPADFISAGPAHIALLRPYALLGLSGFDPVTLSLFWSMLANCLALVGASLFTRQSPIERAQAALFVDAFHLGDAAQIWRRTAPMPDLMTLVARFLGRARTEAAFAGWTARRGHDPAMAEADAEMVSFAERLLAGVIGAPSARVLVASVVQEEPLGVDEVMRILDETSRVIASNRRLEARSQTLERATAALRSANMRLRDLDQLKDDFIATVNHELRTPLTSIRSFSEILRDNPSLPPAERQDFLTIVVAETERLTRLINQLLDLSKIETAGVSDAADIDLGAVARDAAHALQQLFAARGVALIVRLDPAPPVYGSRDRLMQLVLNLLSNAAKFCPADTGRVEMRVGPDGGNTLLAVTDNGPGIREADRDIIFERFRQVGDPLTAKPEGTGLGLAICRMIVGQLGGRIWVDGEFGRGAEFKVRLPAARVAPADLERSREPALQTPK